MSLKALFRDVVATPTTSFHEHAVIALICRKAVAWGYHVQQTPDGNLLVGCQGALRRPTCMLLAHMDHPGLRVLRVKGRFAWVGVMGGLPLEQIRGSRFDFYSGGVRTTGVVVQKTTEQWMGRSIFRVQLRKAIPSEGFGTLAVPSPKWKGDRVSARAMDNLANVASLLGVLYSERHNPRSRLLCVFTRAEEVGMVGTSALISRKTLSQKIPLIVLEASSAKVGKVQLGEGPVIRVGDRVATYSPDLDQWFQAIAGKLMRGKKSFRVQRALLAGGRCEATVFYAHGYCVGGLALPLDCYHNRGRRRLVAEAISWSDWLNLQEFLKAIVRTPFKQSTQLRRDFQIEFQKWSRCL